MNELIYALMTDPAAIQNLDYLRQLISETRAANPQADADRLRMLHGYGVGTDQMTQKNGER
jgi:hypothetical protein